MDDLLRWLGEQFDDDQSAALGAKGDTDGRWTQDDGPPEDIVLYDKSGKLTMGQARHIARHDPARVLREIDAKRQLVRELLEYEAQFDSDRGCGHDADYFASGLHNGHMPKDILGLRLIASGYSHRPGFREEWRP